MSNFFAQLIGFAGIGANFLIYQQKNRSSLLKAKLFSDLIWAVHYFLIGATTAATVACIGALREFIFMKHKKMPTLIFFLLMSILSAVIGWSGYKSFLPAIASALSVISFYLSVPKFSRIAAYPISMLMGTYSLLSGSAAGVVNEILTLISSTIAIAINKRSYKE